MSLVDNRYYESVSANGLAERLLIAARRNIFQDFILRMRPSPSDSIVDVGVSDVINDGANVLERMYPYPNKVTACGIGEAKEFRSTFNKVHYIQIMANATLPFEDHSFEIATSNAVLEHVGSYDNQRFFVSELCRVAKRVFITVPNRFFPVEHHTAIPFAHWQRQMFRVACRVTEKESWSEEQNLILMTRKSLWRLVPQVKRSVAVGYTGLRWGPLSSNLYLAVH